VNLTFEDQALLDRQSLPQICQTRGAGISELFVRRVGAFFWSRNTQVLVSIATVAITVRLSATTAMYGCDQINACGCMYEVNCYACVAGHESIKIIARNLLVNIAKTSRIRGSLQIIQMLSENNNDRIAKLANRFCR
jgi:hypothetical protein